MSIIQTELLFKKCFKIIPDFDVLLSVHLNIILAINQLNAQNLVL